MKNIKVGYTWSTYPYKRNIVEIVEDVNYKNLTDIYKLGSAFLLVLYKLKMYDLGNNLFVKFNHSFNDLNLNNVDLLHFFNSVSYGKTPWISTFETFIPRFPELLNNQENGIIQDNKAVKKGLSALAGNSCKKIIAMSECTLRLEKLLLNEYPEYKDVIQKKLCVIHPPQEVLIDNFKEKKIEKDISFIFVGRDFFRKGGLEVLKVFAKMRNEVKLPIKLTIISGLLANDYASKAGEDEVKLAKEIINKSNWITHYDSLPNNKVLELMKNHHVGLLPTWADTYGYSILEMQACGCPVITTNIRAIPEINDNDKGWVMEVPKNHLDEALYSTKEQRKELSETIQRELEKIILSIFNDKKVINIKAQKSLNYINENHSPEKYAKKIKKIYQDALQIN